MAETLLEIFKYLPKDGNYVSEFIDTIKTRLPPHLSCKVLPLVISQLPDQVNAVSSDVDVEHDPPLPK